jgi:hypothetical protein
MKTIVISILLFFSCLNINAQVEYNYSFALKHFESQVGIWKADNSAYKNENEPITAYVIEWRFGELENSIYGKLYGLIDTSNVGTFWEFHQYWNPIEKKIEILQIGSNGAIGIGFLNVISDNKYELIQLFIDNEGVKRREKHIYIKPNNYTEMTTSFEESNSQIWIQKRTYSWLKN